MHHGWYYFRWKIGKVQDIEQFNLHTENNDKSL